MASVGVVVSVVVVGVLAVVFIAIVVDSVVVVLMVGIVGLVETVEDSGPEFRSLLIVCRTNASIPPRPRSAPRTRKRENGLNFHLLSCRVDTCPSLGGVTGWRKITTLVSFPFISATEPRKVLHLQFVRL